MIGRKFGRLTVLEEVPERAPDRRIRFKCQCDCGRTWVTAGSNLRRGYTRSCGCLSSDVTSEFNKETKSKLVEGVATRHHPLFGTWVAMKQRCYNPKHTYYEYYGGKGVKVCERWVDSFANFVEDMGERPDGYTLDRVDGGEEYSPDNCRWADWNTQGLNKKSVKKIEYRGETLTLNEWSQRLGIKYQTLWWRLNRKKQTAEEAFSNG